MLPGLLFYSTYLHIVQSNVWKFRNETKNEDKIISNQPTNKLKAIKDWNRLICTAVYKRNIHPHINVVQGRGNPVAHLSETCPPCCVLPASSCCAGGGFTATRPGTRPHGPRTLPQKLVSKPRATR